MGETICCGGICMTIPGPPMLGPRTPSYMPMAKAGGGGGAGSACSGGGGTPCNSCPCSTGPGAFYMPSTLNVVPTLNCQVA